MFHLEQFLDFCKFQRGLAENTIRSYKADLSQYMEWLGERGLDPSHIKVKEVDRFLIYLRKENENGIQTVNRKMNCLKTFYRWLQRIEEIEKNPLDLFQNIKKPKILPRYLTIDEQEGLIASSKNGGRRSSWIGKRDYLLIILLLDMGLRISEAVNIRIQDINLGEGILKVKGKGNKERECILSDRVIEGIKEHLSFMREKVKPSPLIFLFSTSHGGQLGSRHTYRMVRDIGRRMGIKDLHPHVLRHTFATNLRRKKADLLLIKEALGHSSVSTTEIYAHLGNEEFRTNLRELIN